MSNYKKINIFDERLVQKEPFVPSYRGVSNISKIIEQPTSQLTASSNQVTFSIPMIPSNYIPRYPMLHSKWQYTLTATNSTGAQINANAYIVAPGVDVSMAEYPFVTNIIGTAETSLNGVSLGTVNMNRVAKQLLSVGEVKQNVKYSTCPSAPELYASVDDANLTLGNSQATFNDAGWDYAPNGSYAMQFSTLQATGNIANAGTQAITVTCETYEPLVGLPPFVWDSKKDDAYSLFGLNNLSINLNLLTDSAKASRALRVLSKSVLNTTNAGVTFAVTNLQMQTCELHYFLMRPPASLSYKVPKQSVIHTYQYYYNSYTNGTLFNDGAGNLVANPFLEMKNYVSSGMPSLMLVWVDPNTDKTLNLNDYKYPITNLTMELGGVQNILNLYTAQDLYNMSKDAGLQSTYLNFIGQAYGITFATDGTPSFPQSVKSLASAPIVLRPGISFPLPDDISTNSAGSYTFSFKAFFKPTNLKNAGGAFIDLNLQPRLNVLCIYDAFVSINTDDLSCVVTKCPLFPWW